MAAAKQWPPKTCARLEKIRDARQAVKAREQDLIRTRKDLRNKFLATGGQRTRVAEEMAWDLQITLMAIEEARAREARLADMMDETIGGAGQGRLFDDDDDIDGTIPDAEEVIARIASGAKHGQDEEEPDQGTLPIGTPGPRGRELALVGVIDEPPAKPSETRPRPKKPAPKEGRRKRA